MVNREVRISSVLRTIVLGACALMIAGCEEFDQMADDARNRQPAPGLMPQQIADAPGNAKSTPANPAETTTPPAADSTAADNASSSASPYQDTTTITERATAGVGVQGQGYGGGIITEPVHQYFHMRDRITFDIQIKKQMQIWKALHNNRNPKNKDEYVKEILEPCGIALPELPQGRRYLYDAKSGELLVESGGPAQ